ncbi:MAG: hypothetical protein GEV06_14140 [Luteitalea sp.]|nr:hypothetical protein [Luteitalea sp.]
MGSTARRVSRVSHRRIWLGLILMGCAGCADSPVGPSLSAVTVSDVRLRPTTENATLCCCRVLATSANRNSVPVHVTVKFAAHDDQREQPLSRILYFIKDFQPDTERAIEASGFFLPCAAIRDVRMEIDVTGIADPPF